MEMKPHPDIVEVVLIDGKPVFPISWLHKQAFCEYQIFLENFKGVVARPTGAMIIGKEKHGELEKEHKKLATEVISISQAIEKSKTEKITVVGRECPVLGYKNGIRGLIDEIEFSPDSINIIDDKPGDKAWPGNIRQVRGYCLAFKEEYSPEVPVIGIIRNRDTKEIIWKETFGHEAETDVSEAIQRIQDLISGKREFEPTKNPNKCKNCRFSIENICDKSK